MLSSKAGEMKKKKTKKPEREKEEKEGRENDESGHRNCQWTNMNLYLQTDWDPKPLSSNRLEPTEPTNYNVGSIF